MIYKKIIEIEIKIKMIMHKLYKIYNKKNFRTKIAMIHCVTVTRSLLQGQQCSLSQRDGREHTPPCRPDGREVRRSTRSELWAISQILYTS